MEREQNSVKSNVSNKSSETALTENPKLPEINLITYEDYFFKDRSSNMNFLQKTIVPINYLKHSFYQERIIESNTHTLRLSLGYFYYSRYYNSEVKIWYQVDFGESNGFEEKARHLFKKTLLEQHREGLVSITKVPNDNLNLLEHDPDYDADNNPECEIKQGGCDFENDIKEVKRYIRFLNDKRVSYDEFIEKTETELNNSEYQNNIEQLFEAEHAFCADLESKEGNFDSIRYFSVVGYNRQFSHVKGIQYGRLMRFDKQIQIKSDFLSKIDDVLIKMVKHASANSKSKINTSESQHQLDININDIEYIPYNSSISFFTELSIIRNYNGSNYITTHTGLINEAMTCYMNSMLQILNSLSYFTQAITKVEGADGCVYGLQRLFYELSAGGAPVSTMFLIRSFGWTTQQLVEQHDIQEFNLKLSDSLEKKLKTTESDGLYKYLFEGRIMNYIKCKGIDFTSTREETIMDISLDVKGFDNIYQSLDSYVKEEILEGENQYDTEKHGKVDAIKGVRFSKLAPVLIMQLKRFEYNFATDSMEKVNDKFEFYKEIDLKKYYMNDEKDKKDYEDSRKETKEYVLHSVVIHSGSLNNGHYYCYINTHTDKPFNWIKFNDESVRYCNELDAIENNFGGRRPYYSVNQDSSISVHNIKVDNSAYILVYIAKELIHTIIDPSTSTMSIPLKTKIMIEQDIEREKQHRIEKSISESNISILLLDGDLISGHSELGISSSSSDNNKHHSLIDNDNPNVFRLSFPGCLKLKDLDTFIGEIVNLKVILFKYDSSK